MEAEENNTTKKTSQFVLRIKSCRMMRETEEKNTNTILPETTEGGNHLGDLGGNDNIKMNLIKIRYEAVSLTHRAREKVQ